MQSPHEINTLVSLPAKTNRLIGQALAEHAMIEDGDRILIAVSGGVDSLVLASVLKLWQKKAPVSYDLHCVHLDMGFPDNNPALIREELNKTGLSSEIITTTLGIAAQQSASGNICYHCARNKRTELFNFCKTNNFNKLAMGHHKEDIIETLFLNLFYGGNISTMLPKQRLFNGNLHIIRPLSFLLKKDIHQLAGQFGYNPVENPCPQSGKSKRDYIRGILQNLYTEDKNLVHRLYSAMGNIKPEYLLDNALKKRLNPTC
jgi:tRNA 2-thiocytidine biosynthesis protein TtcA